MFLVAVFCFFLFFLKVSKSLVESFNVSRLLANRVPSCKGMLHLRCGGGFRGGARGGAAPLFLDQTEARRVKKKLFWDRLPPTYLGIWMTANPPPPLPFIWRSSVWKQFYAKVLSKCCKCTDVGLLKKKHWTDFAFITIHVHRVAGKPKTKASKAVYVNCFLLSLKTKRYSIPSKLEILFFLWSYSETRKGTFMRSWVIFNKQNQQRQRDDKGHGARRS